MKKIFALILALLMLIPAVVACKPSEEEPSSSSSSESSSSSDSSSSGDSSSSTSGGGNVNDRTGRGAGNGFSSKDSVITTWDSTELNVLVTRYGDAAGAPWGQLELNPTSFGDAANQGFVDRQALILDTYGITVNWIEAQGNQSVIGDITTAMTAKDETYEIAYPRAHEVQSLVALVYDMNQSEYLDFDHSYFSQAAYDTFTVLGRTLFATGDMDFSDNQVAYMLFYNKDMLDNIEEGFSEQLYAMVKNGTWTYDYLKNLSKQVKFDNNGNNTPDDGDTYGYGSKYVGRFYSYAGIMEADVDLDTGMYRVALNLDEEKVDLVIANIIECLSGKDWARTGQDTDGVNGWGGSWGANLTTAFNDGRVLFFEEVAQQFDNINSISFSLGVVPFPKLNAEQADYVVPVAQAQTTFACIPKCSISKDMSCYFMDVLAWTGSEYVMDPYYERIEAKMELETVEDDMKIIKEYIFANIAYDPGELTNGWSPLLSDVKSAAYANSTNNFTQVFGEKSEQAELTVGAWNNAWGSYYEDVE